MINLILNEILLVKAGTFQKYIARLTQSGELRKPKFPETYSFYPLLYDPGFLIGIFCHSQRTLLQCQHRQKGHLKELPSHASVVRSPNLFNSPLVSVVTPFQAVQCFLGFFTNNICPVPIILIIRTQEQFAGLLTFLALSLIQMTVPGQLAITADGF